MDLGLTQRKTGFIRFTFTNEYLEFKLCMIDSKSSDKLEKVRIGV